MVSSCVVSSPGRGTCGADERRKGGGVRVRHGLRNLPGLQETTQEIDASWSSVVCGVEKRGVRGDRGRARNGNRMGRKIAPTLADFNKGGRPAVLANSALTYCRPLLTKAKPCIIGQYFRVEHDLATDYLAWVGPGKPLPIKEWQDTSLMGEPKFSLCPASAPPYSLALLTTLCSPPLPLIPHTYRVPTPSQEPNGLRILFPDARGLVQ